MSDTSGDAPRRIDVCLRAAGPEAWNHQQRIIDRLGRMEDRGLIDGYRVQTWGKVASPSGPLSGTRFHSAAVGTVREFEAWADAREDVEVPFHHDEFRCEFTDQRHPVIRLPVVCLGVYEGGDLVDVYPHSEGAAFHTVRDALAALAESGDGGSGESPIEVGSAADGG